MTHRILTEVEALEIYLGLNTGDDKPLKRFFWRMPDMCAWYGQSDEEKGEVIKLLHELLRRPEYHDYAEKMIDRLPEELLVAGWGDQEQPLLANLIFYGHESWALRVYERALRELDLETYSYEMVDSCLPMAYKTGKYALLRMIYSAAFSINIPYDNPLFDGWHPICYAAKKDDTKLAKAYLDARELEDGIYFMGSSLLIPPGWRTNQTVDPLPLDYNTGILEEVALSKSTRVMELLLNMGADPNARNSRGETLYDVAQDPDMRELLQQWGGVPSTEQERLLFLTSRSLRRSVVVAEDPFLSYSKENFDSSLLWQVLRHKKPLFRFMARFGTHEPDDRYSIDLLHDLVDAGKTFDLCMLYGAVKDQLDEKYNHELLRVVFGEGPFGGFFFFFERKPEFVLDMVRGLEREGLRTSHIADGETIAYKAMYELMRFYAENGEIDIPMMAEFCRVLCRITGDDPVEVFSHAWMQLDHNRCDLPVMTHNKIVKMFEVKR